MNPVAYTLDSDELGALLADEDVGALDWRGLLSGALGGGFNKAVESISKDGPGMSTLWQAGLGIAQGLGTNLFQQFGKNQKAPPRATPVQRGFAARARQDPQNPFKTMDALLMQHPEFAQMLSRGALPSQALLNQPQQAIRNMRNLAPKVAAIARNPIEKSLLTAQAATGIISPAITSLAPLNFFGDEAMPNQEPTQPGTSVAGSDNVEGYEEDVGSLPAGPAPHLARLRIPPQVFKRWIMLVPGTRDLAPSTRALLAGFGPRANDTSGVVPSENVVVRKTGESLADIAERLTGERERVVEIDAANPGLRDTMRPRIPPNWGRFEDTGAIRPEITRRTYTVKKGDSPVQIAIRCGQFQQSPKWWSQLKTANPHKSVTPKGDNFVFFSPGEIINIPDEWPQWSGFAAAFPSAVNPSVPMPSNAIPNAPMLRTYIVQKGDSPVQIAIRSGAFNQSPQWWSQLKTANPQKTVTPKGDNFRFFNPGEILNIPAEWPDWPGFTKAGIPGLTLPNQQAIPSPSPSPAPSPSPTPSIPATSDTGVILQAQTILAVWGKQYPGAAAVKDFGATPLDMTGAMTDRTTSQLKSFQQWNNATKATSLLVDGELNPPTWDALKAYALGSAPNLPLPTVPQPNQPSPSTPSPGSSTTNSTPSQGKGIVDSLGDAALPIALTIGSFLMGR